MKGEKHHKGEVSVSAAPVLIDSVDGSKLQPTPIRQWDSSLEEELLDHSIGGLWLEEAGLRPRNDDSPDEVCFKLDVYASCDFASACYFI